MASSARKKDNKFSTNWVAYTGYETMQEDAPIRLNNYQEKRYRTRGMYLI